MRTPTPKTAQATPAAAKLEKAAAAPSHAMKQAARKVKVVRDRYTMPEEEYGKLVELKSKCLAAGMHVKKSELLRIGLHFMETLPVARLKAAVTALEGVKTGHKAVRKAAKTGKLH